MFPNQFDLNIFEKKNMFDSIWILGRPFCISKGQTEHSIPIDIESKAINRSGTLIVEENSGCGFSILKTLGMV